MTSVCIGVHVYEEPLRLRNTLESIWANTRPPFELLLLADGPDQALQKELSALSHLTQSRTESPAGAAACFNRLASSTTADVVVLLESGCLVGNGWLEGLRAALEAHPSHGLAGPSTNRSWNEQYLSHPGLIPTSANPTMADVDRVARAVHQRFGNALQYLEPLHSLADFCYAVRREVVEALGAADEEYGLGPCWEMDYNIRAARAGLRGVWACGSYVHRPPFSPRRAEHEARLFSASKRRYQDKFCALRLRKQSSGYEDHCKGDMCEHFAPADLIQICREAAPNVVRPRVAQAQLRPNAPLVSCIMATAHRPAFVLQSINYFQRQDYPNRELIVLDDANSEDLAQQLAGDDRIRYFRLPHGLSIGAKRNRGCELARGTFIAQWDDDDWYAPARLTTQIEPLLCGGCQISALSAGVFFDLPARQFWRISADLHRRMFVGDVHGGTLVFHRSLFDRGIRYPDRSIAEDAWFLWQATQHGSQVRRIAGDDLFVYVRHGSSTWAFQCGQFLDPQGWQRVEEPEVLKCDMAFYRKYGPAVERDASKSSHPLVSCIMPTANRRKFVPAAIGYFLRQDYDNRELLVMDDGTDAVADLVPDDSRIRYFRLQDRLTVGAKRNCACQQAAGDYILHWDDDDWGSPRRISVQMNSLLGHPEIDICGLSQLYFFDPASGQGWLYSHPAGSRSWISGNTLCYRKTLWHKHPFPEINEGEDTLFVWSLSERQMLALTDPSFFVATIHEGNTSPKRTQTPGWTPVSEDVIAQLLGSEFDGYRGQS